MKRCRAALVMIFALSSAAATAALKSHAFTVRQIGRAFSLSEISIAVGDTIHFANQDGFLHQIFIHDPKLTIDSDEQKPGDIVDVQFPVVGTYHVLCAIHPKMALVVNVQ